MNHHTILASAWFVTAVLSFAAPALADDKAPTAAPPAAPASAPASAPAAPASAPSNPPPAAPASGPRKDTTAITPTRTRTPSAAEVEEARVHFQRGIEFFGEESYEAALVEFQRAYEIAPSYQILYNTGRIHAELKDYARALRDLKRYLLEGGDAVPDDRRQQVLTLTRSLEQKVATLEIVSSVPGAHISVDDVPVGDAPLKGIVVNPGDRRVTASKEGYLPSTVVVTVVSSEARNVPFKLTPMNQSRVVVQKSSIAPVIGWATTGVLAVGAVACGIVALNAEKDLDERKNTEVGGGPDAFEDDASKVKTWSIASDGLAIGAVVAAGVSLYLTLKGSGSESPPKSSAATGLMISPRSVAFRGAF